MDNWMEKIFIDESINGIGQDDDSWNFIKFCWNEIKVIEEKVNFPSHS